MERLKRKQPEEITEEAPYGYKKSGKPRTKPKGQAWENFKEIFPDIGAGILDAAGNFVPGLDPIADIIRGLDGPSEEEKEAAIAYARQLELDIFNAEIQDLNSARDMNKESLKSTDAFVRRFPYWLAAGILFISMLFMGLILFGEFAIVDDVAWMIVGTLMSGFTTVIAFFFGSSIGSKMKDSKDSMFK